MSAPWGEARGAGRPGSPFEQEYPGGSESANASVVALVRAGEAFLALIGGVLRRYGLSPAGAQVLAVIEGAGGPLSPTVIAERLIVTTATVKPEVVALQTAVMADVTEPQRAAFQQVLAKVQAGLIDVNVEAVIAQAKPRRRPKRR